MIFYLIIILLASISNFIYHLQYIKITSTIIIFSALYLILKSYKNKNKHHNKVNIIHRNTLTELETAKKVQEALLSIETPKINSIKIAKKCIPAKTLGGDFYTFINKNFDKLKKNKNIPGILEYGENQNNILGVAIGDVAGHGVSSALVMALSSGLIDKIGQNNHSPAIILQRANLDIQKFISNSQISHVTAFYGNINLNEMKFTYSNAGHQPALLIHKDGTYELLTTDGIFLGMYPDEIYEEKSKTIEYGDRICLFTDGIVESSNPNNELYGMIKLKQMLIENAHLNINDLIQKIYDDLNTFRNKKDAKDDQTAIIIEISNNVD